MVPTPRLSQGLFNRLEPVPEDSSKDRLRQLASRHGIDNLSKPIPMASRIKLDMVVIGSVAVDRLGHRIGKGEGKFCTLYVVGSLEQGSGKMPPAFHRYHIDGVQSPLAEIGRERFLNKYNMDEKHKRT